MQRKDRNPEVEVEVEWDQVQGAQWREEAGGAHLWGAQSGCKWKMQEQACGTSGAGAYNLSHKHAKDL